jgi:hypothetical protein
MAAEYVARPLLEHFCRTEGSARSTRSAWLLLLLLDRLDIDGLTSAHACGCRARENSFAAAGVRDYPNDRRRALSYAVALGRPH